MMCLIHEKLVFNNTRLSVEFRIPKLNYREHFVLENVFISHFLGIAQWSHCDPPSTKKVNFPRFDVFFRDTSIWIVHSRVKELRTNLVRNGFQSNGLEPKNIAHKKISVGLISYRAQMPQIAKLAASKCQIS